MEKASTTGGSGSPRHSYSNMLIPHRIFINEVDTFNAKYFAAYVTEKVVGASKLLGAGIEEGGGEEIREEAGNPESDEIKQKYECIGSLKKAFRKPTEDILYIVKKTDSAYFPEMLRCGVIIFDITQSSDEIPTALKVLQRVVDKIEKIKAIGPKTFEKFQDKWIFVLISTIMTWGKTKPLDPEDPDIPFSEIDYKKRRPHPNYKEHIACEREVIQQGRKYPNHLKTYVICSGLTYGQEEEDFEVLFKMAWYNEKYLPIFGTGMNFVPVIHVEDLAKVIHRVIDNPPSEPQYILAVEQIPCTYRKVVKNLSKFLGRGLTKEVAEEEAFLYQNISQQHFERFTVNLKMEPVFIVETLQLDWKNDLNLADNMREIVNEFRTCRNLKPIKIVLHGPPGVGKTEMARKLCQKYGCHYVNAEAMVQETLDNLHENLESEKLKRKQQEDKTKKETEEAVEIEEEELDEVDVEGVQEQIAEIVTALSRSETGQLRDEMVVRLMRDFLVTNACQNQGYVLDGYPETLVQAKELFGHAADSSNDEEAEESPQDVFATQENPILPNYVISLEATDEFLCNKIRQLPEIKVEGTRFSEEPFTKRLADYRQINTEDNTVLIFFDEHEIYPLIFNVADDDSADGLECIYQKLCDVLGDPIGFGLSIEEEKELAELQVQNEQLEKETEKMRKKMLEEEASKEYREKMEAWTETLEQLQMEEEKILAAKSEPLRYYLMKYIFPVLTKGLLEVARIKPEDPIDFLAEYLFKENPEGRMFDPAYTRDGERLLKKYEDNVQSILDESEIN